MQMDDRGNGNKTICFPEIEALKTKDSGEHKVFKYANNYRVYFNKQHNGNKPNYKSCSLGTFLFNCKRECEIDEI